MSHHFVSLLFPNASGSHRGRPDRVKNPLLSGDGCYAIFTRSSLRTASMSGELCADRVNRPVEIAFATRDRYSAMMQLNATIDRRTAGIRPGSMPFSLLLVDDEEDILRLLRYNLEKEGYTVHTALDGTEAVEKAENLDLDLVVLDIMMPGLDGYDVCRRLRASARHQTTPIIFLTAKGGEVDEILGLELGADDYVQKPISPRVLVARVKRIFRRNSETVQTETIVAPEILRVDRLVINRQNYTVTVDGIEKFFPKKEFELLAYLAANPGRAFSRDELLARIWGETVQVVERTVDVHVSKVRDKLGDLSNRIETVKGVGYRFV